MNLVHNWSEVGYTDAAGAVELYSRVFDHILIEERHRLLEIALTKEEGSRFLEIGSYKGDSLVPLAIAARFIRAEKVISIDKNLRNLMNLYDYGIFHATEMAHNSMRWNLIAMDLTEYVSLISDESASAITYLDLELDILHIDGDHTLRGCTEDIQNYLPLVKVGGHVIIHDYNVTEVRQAIKENIELTGRFSNPEIVEISYITERLA